MSVHNVYEIPKNIPEAEFFEYSSYFLDDEIAMEESCTHCSSRIFAISNISEPETGDDRFEHWPYCYHSNLASRKYLFNIFEAHAPIANVCTNCYVFTLVEDTKLEHINCVTEVESTNSFLDETIQVSFSSDIVAPPNLDSWKTTAANIQPIKTNKQKMLGEEMEYRVNWTIELTAHSFEEAAQKALAIQRDPESVATVFDIHQRSMPYTERRIDVELLIE